VNVDAEVNALVRRSVRRSSGSSTSKAAAATDLTRALAAKASYGGDDDDDWLSFSDSHRRRFSDSRRRRFSDNRRRFSDTRRRRFGDTRRRRFSDNRRRRTHYDNSFKNDDRAPVTPAPTPRLPADNYYTRGDESRIFKAQCKNPAGNGRKLVPAHSLRKRQLLSFTFAGIALRRAFLYVAKVGLQLVTENALEGFASSILGNGEVEATPATLPSLAFCNMVKWPVGSAVAKQAYKLDNLAHAAYNALAADNTPQVGPGNNVGSMRKLVDSHDVCADAFKDVFCLDALPPFDCSYQTACLLTCRNINTCATNAGLGTICHNCNHYCDNGCRTGPDGASNSVCRGAPLAGSVFATHIAVAGALLLVRRTHDS